MTFPTDPAAMANGINSSNTVVGVDGNLKAIFVPPNGMDAGMEALLPTPSSGIIATSVAFGINDQGVIVGQDVNESTHTTPGFILTPGNNGTFTFLNPTDQMTGMPATVTNAQGVNNNGVGVGFESSNGVNQFGFKFDLAGNTTPLPNPSTPLTQQDGLVLTQFLGVNDSGEAVGYYQTNGGSQHGFLYNLNTNTYTFLDDPNAVAGTSAASITQITGINNAGEITGFYLDANGLMHGFFATATPEPASLTLAGLGAIGLLAYRLRRRKTTTDVKA